jgi:hypothetical protein
MKSKVQWILLLFSGLILISCEIIAEDSEDEVLKSIEIYIGNQKIPILKRYLELNGEQNRYLKKDTIRISEPIRDIKLHLWNHASEGSEVFGLTIYHEKPTENYIRFYGAPFFNEGHIVLHRTFDEIFNEWYYDTLDVSKYTKDVGFYRIVFYERSYTGTPDILYELFCHYTPKIDLEKQNPKDLVNLIVGKWMIKEVAWEWSGKTDTTISGWRYYARDADEDDVMHKTWEININLFGDSVYINGMSDNYERVLDVKIGNIILDSIFFIGYNKNIKKINQDDKYDHASYKSTGIYFVNDYSAEFNNKAELKNIMKDDSFVHTTFMSIVPRKQFQYFSETPTELKLIIGRDSHTHSLSSQYESVYLGNYYNLQRIYHMKKIE